MFGLNKNNNNKVDDDNNNNKTTTTFFLFGIFTLQPTDICMFYNIYFMDLHVLMEFP
jgi:hypothetical protein